MSGSQAPPRPEPPASSASKGDSSFGIRRRAFLKAMTASSRALAGAGAVFGSHRMWGRANRPIPAPVGQEPLRPPGARPEAEFLARCISCYLCGEVCPPACIEFPDAVQGVDVGLRRPQTGPARELTKAPRWSRPGTPWVLPWQTACILCMRCAEVCPTGALEPPGQTATSEYGTTAMGRAAVDEKICLPFNRISWCGACYTACPLKNVAIELDYRNRPKVLEGCVGCGLCVEVCPIKYKAIAIRSAVPPDEGKVRRE